jgi:hypothetical protein
MLALGCAAAQAQSAGPVPNISGIWERAWQERQLFDPPASGPGPVTGDPAHPHIRGANSPWIADATSPILRPETAAKLRAFAEQQFAGKALLDNDTLCLPIGVLGSLNMFDPLQILQTPTQVTFLYARDHQVRTVYLKRAHPPVLSQTWYGDSIGHYEGDTLVVDTIGMNDKTLVDRYGTPHSEQLHTVERYRPIAGGMIEASVVVEDPAVFTTIWSATAKCRQAENQSFEEIVCAENNPATVDPSLQIPTDPTPDF